MKIKHIFWNIAGLSIPLVIAAITIPSLLERIGPQRFGLITLAWSLIGFAGVLDLGVGRAATQKISTLRGGPNESSIPLVLKSAIHATIAPSLIGFGLAALLAAFDAASLLKTSDVSLYEKNISILIIGASIPIQSITSIYRGTNEAYLNFKKISLVRMLLGCANFGAPLAISLITNNIHWLIASLLISRIIALYYYRKIAHGILPKDKYYNAIDSKSMQVQLLKFGGWVTVSGLLNPIVNISDRFIIGSLFSTEMVTSYVIPYEMVTQSLVIVGATTTVFFPYISNLRANKPEKSNRHFLLMTSCVATLMSIITIGFIVFGELILSTWIEKSIDNDGYIALKILSLGLVPYAVASMATSYIHAHGRSNVTGIMSAISFPISLAMIYYMTANLGIKGAAIAWVTRITIESIIYSIYAAKTNKLQ